MRVAIEQRLQREAQRHRAGVADGLMAIGARMSARQRLIVGDANSALGYDGADCRADGHRQLGHRCHPRSGTDALVYARAMEPTPLMSWAACLKRHWC